MNINNTLALQNTKMVKTYCAIDPRVRPLAMAIKHWTRQRALNDAGKIPHFILYIYNVLMKHFSLWRNPVHIYMDMHDHQLFTNA